MNELPPPGFYPDSSGVDRWWDGAQWTGTTREPQEGGPASGPAYAQQFGQPGINQPGQPFEPPKKSKLPLVLGLAAVAVALLLGVGALVAVLMLSGEDPETVVEGYLDAAIELDCDASRDFLSAQARAEVNCEGYTQPEGQDFEADYEIVDSETDGDEAEVRTEETFSTNGAEQSGRCTYELVKEDGDWLIDEVNCTRDS